MLVGVIAIVVAIILPFMPFASRAATSSDQAIVILTYVMLGWGLNIVVGLAGLLDLGYVAFYAVGAYSFALLAHHFGWCFWVCLPLAGILARLWGIILGFPVLRLRGDYLAIVTLAFGEIIRLVLHQLGRLHRRPATASPTSRARRFFGIPFNRGPDGFADDLRPRLLADPPHHLPLLHHPRARAGHQLRHDRACGSLPIGRAWEALREDEIACRSLGINTTNTKLTAFAMRRHVRRLRRRRSSPPARASSRRSASTSLESSIILAIVVLGGLGSQIGVVIARRSSAARTARLVRGVFGRVRPSNTAC